MPNFYLLRLNDLQVCLEVLEKVLSEIDEKLQYVYVQHPTLIFKRIHKQVVRNAETMRQLHDGHAKEGYVRIRKAHSNTPFF